MGTPLIDLISDLEGSRGQPHRFQSEQDFDGQNRWIGESIRQDGACVHLMPRATHRDPQGSAQSSGVDELYGDVLDIEFLADDEDPTKDARMLNFFAYIDHKPSKQDLKKWGIVEHRDTPFYFPYVLLNEAGLITEKCFRGINIGDLVFWDNTWYIANSAHRVDYFGQTDKFFFTLAVCSRYNHNSTVGAEE